MREWPSKNVYFLALCIDRRIALRMCRLAAMFAFGIISATDVGRVNADYGVPVGVSMDRSQKYLTTFDLETAGSHAPVRYWQAERIDGPESVATGQAAVYEPLRPKGGPRPGHGWRILTRNERESLSSANDASEQDVGSVIGFSPHVTVAPAPIVANAGAQRVVSERHMRAGDPASRLPGAGERLAQGESANEPEPASLDELFRVDEPAAEPAPGKAPESADSLFGLEAEAAEPVSRIHGFFQNEIAYTYPSPAHWSKTKNILELVADGQWGSNMRWKASGRASYDPIYDLSDFYPEDVGDDQRLEADVRETYLDISAGDWDLRLGRQHIVWGEVVGLFFADVVSAKDLREFVLPDFDMLRIPQWAARAEHFRGDLYAEVIWIPYMTYDNIGKPGGDFYPLPLPPPPGFDTIILDEQRPANTLKNSAYGLRLSYLFSGWDVSGFYYGSTDATPSFERRIVDAPTPAFIYRPGHDRIDQVGITLAKDLGRVILNGEAVYTWDRLFSVTRLSEPDGLVPQDFLDYIVGLEFSLPRDARFNVQFFQRRFSNHDVDIVQDDVESGFTLYLSTQLNAKTEPEILFVRSLNRNDWMLQAKITWRLKDDWRFVAGVDVFEGPPLRLFGQFDQSDRVYSELRYSF